MPTPFAHGLAGYAVLVLAEPRLASDLRENLKAMGTGIFFGTLADADFLVAYFTSNPVLQHHYFSHSIPFAFLIGAVSYLFLKILKLSHPFRTAVVLTAAYGTHLLLDYFTHDGSQPIGIPLFWPFTHRHLIAPVEIFASIHRGGMETLFGAHNFGALSREAIILIPLALAAYLKSRRSKSSLAS